MQPSGAQIMWLKTKNLFESDVGIVYPFLLSKPFLYQLGIIFEFSPLSFFTSLKVIEARRFILVTSSQYTKSKNLSRNFRSLRVRTGKRTYDKLNSTEYHAGWILVQQLHKERYCSRVSWNFHSFGGVQNVLFRSYDFKETFYYAGLFWSFGLFWDVCNWWIALSYTFLSLDFKIFAGHWPKSDHSKHIFHLC